MKQNKLNRTVGITSLSQDVAYVAVTATENGSFTSRTVFIFQLLKAKQYCDCCVKGPDFQTAQKPRAGRPRPGIADPTPEKCVWPELELGALILKTQKPCVCTQVTERFPVLEAHRYICIGSFMVCI